jgi:hypothetical protein
MTVTSTPIFVQTTKNKFANVVAATTDYTGATTANIITLLTAGANGSKVFEIIVTVPVTSAAAHVQVWVDDAGAGTLRLIDTIPITVITVSTTVAPYRISRTYDNFILTALSLVRVGVSIINNPTVVHALYGDY